MNKKLLSISLVLLLITTFLPFSSAQGDINSAIAYLKTKSPNPWITMALVAAGETADVDYLKSATGTKATDYEAVILALAAAGENPRTFPNTDLVAALKGFHTSNQIGDASTLNDDIFGVLALIAAGEPSSETVVQDAKNFILSHQNSDGGFPFAVGSGSDTNMTATAIMALLETGVSKTDSHIVGAVAYLKSTQNNDGGFPYDPQSSWGTSSDASSDAWVISTINKLGENPQSWTKGGHNPIEHLNSLQTNAGYFEYQKGTGEDSFSPVTASYAVIALSGKYYPVAPPVAPNVDYKIEGSAGILCEGSVNTPDPLELVKLIASTCGFTYHIQETSFGPYLDKIGNDEAAGMTGWLYAVNFVMPNVGAADYDLQNGDYVIWHFGNFDWQPVGAAELNLSVNIMPVEGPGTGSQQEENDSVSFNVNVSGGGNNLSFGDAAPGAVRSQTVTIANLGTNSLYIESVVNGDEVFRNYLNIDNVSWRDFSITLQNGGNKNAEVKLEIPSSYSNPGTKSGKLIFWAKSGQ